MIDMASARFETVRVNYQKESLDALVACPEASELV